MRHREWERMSLIWDYAYLTCVSVNRLNIQERLCFNNLWDVVCMKIWLRMRQKRESKIEREREGERQRHREGEREWRWEMGAERVGEIECEKVRGKSKIMWHRKIER